MFYICEYVGYVIDGVIFGFLLCFVLSRDYLWSGCGIVII